MTDPTPADSDNKSAELAAGEKLAGTPYRIIGKLGAGAMGVVYEVEHEHLELRRALKVIAPRLVERSDMERRMRLEAKTLARLRHPNVVEVFDLGFAENGRIFFAMELLEGRTLREVLDAKGKLRPGTAIAVVRQALRGLDAAHALGLVHRDVKPDNLFVCKGDVVKVLDFGIAKLRDAGNATLTETGFTLGTPRYMAPEQIKGRAVDARADVYAVGLVLYECVAGRAPFGDREPLALAYAHTTLAPRALDPEVPERLTIAIARALEKDPGKRFATAAEFEDELRACGESLALTVDRLDDLPDHRLVSFGSERAESEPTRTAEQVGLREGPPTEPLPRTLHVASAPSRKRAVAIAAAFTMAAVAAWVWSASRRPSNATHGDAVARGHDVVTSETVATTSATALSAAREPNTFPLGIGPAGSRVEVEGHEATVTNGTIWLTGTVGEIRNVRLSHAGNSRSERVTLTVDGAVPSRIEIIAPQPVVRPATPQAIAPIVVPAVPSAASKVNQDTSEFR